MERDVEGGGRDISSILFKSCVCTNLLNSLPVCLGILFNYSNTVAEFEFKQLLL